ncbi:MAG: hypothetical protein DRJ45_08205, partial [Thermoprotei archaeon]
MKKNRILIAIGILGIFLFSAFLFTLKFQKNSEKEVICANGTIKYIHLEGGFYGIETEKGEKYLPLNLPDEFKRNGLRIWFKAKPRKVATIHMWGKPIEILEIKKLEESKNVSQIKNVKVAVWYQTITDYKAFNRTLDDVITHLKETNTDFIFRA